MSTRWEGGDLEREALDAAKASLVAGKSAADVAADLDEATKVIAAAREVFCDFCDEPIKGKPVQDPEQVSWLGTGAQMFCSKKCRKAWDEHRVNAAGNDPS